MQRGGVAVLWRSNNFGEPALHVGSRLSADEIRRQCLAAQADCRRLDHDEVLLFGLDRQIRESTPGKVFVVLHEAGSHGPEYFRKYPPEFEVFKPVCATVDQQKCTHEELVNAYDDSILYTDFVLSRVIESLKALGDVPAVMLYVSDHGESLGEYGLYLHGTPYSIAPRFQTEVPFLVWMSDSFARDRNLEGRKIELASAVFPRVRLPQRDGRSRAAEQCLRPALRHLPPAPRRSDEPGQVTAWRPRPAAACLA